MKRKWIVDMLETEGTFMYMDIAEQNETLKKYYGMKYQKSAKIETWIFPSYTIARRERYFNWLVLNKT